MRKQYIKLFVFTLIFDLVYLIGFNWERQFRDARIYGGPFALSFVPALFLYMIFYGYYSYIATKKLIIPNCLLLFLLVLLFVGWSFIAEGISETLILSNLLLCFVDGFRFVGFSLLSGLLTKIVCFLRKNK